MDTRNISKLISINDSFLMYHAHAHIYMHVCVCVCTCVYLELSYILLFISSSYFFLNFKDL